MCIGVVTKTPLPMARHKHLRCASRRAPKVAAEDRIESRQLASFDLCFHGRLHVEAFLWRPPPGPVLLNGGRGEAR